MPGTLPKRADEEGLDVPLHHRPEIIDAPDAVDDRRYAREKLDRHPMGRRRGSQQSSVRKTATPSPTGTAINIAINDVTSVP